MNIQELIEALDTFLQDKFSMNEMSNYKGKKYNLPVNICVDGPRALKHGKRIKFQNNYSEKFDETDLLTLTISEEPQLGKTLKKIRIKNRDIEKLKQWVILNKDILFQFADGNIDSQELGSMLKPIQ